MPLGDVITDRSAMSRRGVRLLWAMIAAGTLARLVVAFTTAGVAFDVEAFGMVRSALHSQPLQVYSEVGRWPYPPGFFVWVLGAGSVSPRTGLPFNDLIQLPAIVADAVIAWLVQDFLGRRGFTQGTRLAAAGLVALGPAFFVVSGYHGQIDSIAILPALLAVVIWERWDHRSRALAAGAFIGVGGVLKTAPLLVLLALLPWCRSKREGLALAGSAIAIPLVAFLPFLVADQAGVIEALRYRGVPGVGGISLLVQPELARAWMNDLPVEGTALTYFLFEHGGLVTGAALAAVGGLLFRYRPPPVVGAALVWLAVYAFGINFFLQYVVWGLPFLLMAGYVRQVAWAQLALVPATILVYLRPWEDAGAALAYIPAALGVWAGFTVAFLLLAGRVARDSRLRRPFPGLVGPRAAH